MCFPPTAKLAAYIPVLNYDCAFINSAPLCQA